MAVRDEPVLGNWYHDADTEQEFQVVAYDDIGGIVEVRFDDGDPMTGPLRIPTTRTAKLGPLAVGFGTMTPSFRNVIEACLAAG